MKKHFQMFAAYNQWANRLVCEAAARLPDEDYRLNRGAFFGSVHGTLNHMLVADRVWMKRFTGAGDAPTRLDIILCDDLQKLSIEREKEDQRIIDWLAGAEEKLFAGRFTYTTIVDMRQISQRIGPALAHFFNHQTHHRGQTHALLTGFGQESLVMDLVYFTRSESGRKWA